MSEWTMKIACMGAGYVGGPTMAVIAKKCPSIKVLLPCAGPLASRGPASFLVACTPLQAF
eukprot:1643363-Alexandrium_andersonii.AAC.1